MLKSITLRFDHPPHPIIIEGSGITVFVGPNSSGKSLALRELQEFLDRDDRSDNTCIISDIEPMWPREADFIREFTLLEKPTSQPIPSNQVNIGYFSSNGNLSTAGIPFARLLESVRAKGDKHVFFRLFARYFLTRLDGRTRFYLLDERPQGDLLEYPTNILAKILVDDIVRENVRKLVHDAFGLYLVVDPTSGGRLRLRLSKTQPPEDELSFSAKAREFHRQAIRIEDTSDGVQAYVSIIISILSGYYKIIILDEPEAFLHPPLAKKLGAQLAEIAEQNMASLFVATHSSDFLLGCIERSANVKVVRLDYREGKSTGRVADPAMMRTIFTHPLMRNTHVVDAMFHDGVIITESDNDRVFYSEIYRRLIDKGERFPNVLFLNAQNKQTIKDMMGPLRTLGVPAAAIADIDVVKEGGAVWAGWLRASNIPESLHAGIAEQRRSLKERFDASGKDMKRHGGIECLTGGDKGAASVFFDMLENFGVFVVRGGELESWLSHLDVQREKSRWTVAILERMGHDPAAADYVKPDDHDVWAFLRRVLSWIADPDRRGVT